MRKNPVAMLGAAIGAVVLIAILAVILAEVRRNTTYPAGSPQSAVQSYLEEIGKDAKVIAFSYVAKESPCTQQDMDASFGASIKRTFVQFAQMEGDRGTIGMRLELGYRGVFDSRVTLDRTFSLVREDGEWKLTNRIWPMETCG
jgi:hypothetical protein